MCDLLLNDDDRRLPPYRFCELFGAGGKDKTIVTSLTRAISTGGTCLQVSVQKGQHFGVVVPDRLSSEHSASPKTAGLDLYWQDLEIGRGEIERRRPDTATTDRPASVAHCRRGLRAMHTAYSDRGIRWKTASARRHPA